MTKRKVAMRSWRVPFGIAVLVALAACAEAPLRSPLPTAPMGPYPPGSFTLPDPAAAPLSSQARPGGARVAMFGAQRASRDARSIADWVVDSDDSHGLPFIVVDKKQAKVYAFGSDGWLRGASPALLGLAPGDDSVPGIGERPMAEIRPEERTTPAGRFEAEMGRNTQGEDILWVDYDAAVSLHRVRPTNPLERRLERLASKTPADNRISYGCINVPAAFYDAVVKPLFAARNGVVYVLPEIRPMREVFNMYETVRTSGRGSAR